MEESAAIVRRLYEAWNRGGEVSPELAPEFEWVSPEEAVEPGTRTGIDQSLHAMRQVRESFRTARVEIERLTESGDRVAAIVTLHFEGRASGAETKRRQGHVWTIRDGQAVRFEWFNDPEQATDAVADRSSETRSG